MQSAFNKLLNASLGAAMALTVASAANAGDPLPKLSIDTKAISVSGLSSGAYMTMQMHVAHSSTFMGAGVIAGGPYYCAAGNMANVSICMGQTPVPPNAALLYEAAQSFAALGQIDALSNLQPAKVYLYTGTNDSVVGQSAVNAAKQFYQLANIPASAIQYVDTVPSGHAFISGTFGNDCSVNATPYISQCKVGTQLYDQAGVVLQQIYGALNPPNAALTGQIKTYDQTLYGADNSLSGLSPEGHIYVPAACTASDANCRLHLSIHGCKQNQTDIGDDWYTKLNLNNWADANKIVVIYPQVSSSTIPYNPQGCWDWWGYTGPNYAIKSGLQITALKKMVDAVSQP